jgi:hypothetical protein
MDMLKRPDSWWRLCFALVIFWAVLCFADLLLGDVTAFNANLNRLAVARGYITALRGLMLLVLLTAALVMAALLRRGFIIAPLIWLAQVGRIAYTLPWQEAVKNLLFVSPALNLAAFSVLPVLLALLIWQALERIDPRARLGVILPGLWLLLVLLSAAGNLFTWHWSGQLHTGAWPGGYGAIAALTGAVLLVLAAGRYPWGSLALFFGGLLMPAAICMAIWGGYDGLCLALLALLPWCPANTWEAWLGLMALVGLPLLLVTAVHQVLAWRRGAKLLEII